MSSLGITLSNALIVTRREVRDSFRDWRIVAPILILTFLFPALAQFVANEFSAYLAGFGAELIGERTIPFLLMIVGFFPISISLVIALETFVGEKERRSLEPLLSTPLTNTELYIGKTLAAMIPPLVASYGGMGVYMAGLVGGELAWRPAGTLIFQIVLLTTVQALVMVTGAVVVSSQATSTRAANLLASFIIIPMALVIQGESVIMFLAPDANSQNGISALWAIIVGMLLVAILLLRVGAAIFNREELLGRALDALNLRGALGKVWRRLRAVDQAGTPAKSVLEWYRRGIPLAFSGMRGALIVTVIVFVGAFLFGYLMGMRPEYRLPLTPDLLQTDVEALDTLQELFPVNAAIGFYIMQNARVLLAATLLAAFTFGVAALIINPLVFAVIGYLVAQFIIGGLDLSLIAAAILPHGWIEVPVIVVSTAAAVRLGAIVTRLPRGQTVGQAWMQTLADTIKIGVGVIAPGLVIAAIFEAAVTTRIVAAVLTGG